MAWSVTQLTVDFHGNAVTVGLSSPGGSSGAGSSVTVTFPVVDNSNLPVQDADRTALLAQAKQLLTDAAGSLGAGSN